MAIIIKGTGSFIPDTIITNQAFENSIFFDSVGKQFDNIPDVIRKFKVITGIQERRYADKEMQASDLATIAAERAIKDAGIDPEKLDGIILAHNFGDVPYGKLQSDILPSLSTRVKHNLGIVNPDCIAFDILFGCPGWLQGMIIARQYLLSGEAKNFLVIGAETLSRVIDPFDRDSMIFADGAAAAVIQRDDELKNVGILTTASRTFTAKEAYYLHYDESYAPGDKTGNRFIKMEGRKIYEFALVNVPAAMKKCFDASGRNITELKKIFIHQANEKMDEAIIREFFKLYEIKEIPKDIMPMSIHKLGNSSVATIPTLLDTVLKGFHENHELKSGDLILMASVGAGMNVNAITYVVA